MLPCPSRPVPSEVQNIRVFLYRPTTNTSIRTALVTWDDMKYVEQYTVNVYNSDGSQLQKVRRDVPDVVTLVRMSGSVLLLLYDVLVTVVVVVVMAVEVVE